LSPRTQYDTMRSILALILAVALAACRTVPHAGGEASPVVEFLLTSAAADFHAHPPPAPVRSFRDVRSGSFTSPDGTRQYLLCGEFSTARDGGKIEWTPFVTIKTSGYEQYLGAQATHFCKRSTTTWDVYDWSASLQSRLAALR